MAEEQITYKDLPAEHKKKYDELKAICEAELIGSSETTRSRNIKLRGNTCLSHGVNTVDLSHSIREPGFSFDVNMAGFVIRHGADKAESSHSRGKDKEEAVPRDRPQDDDRRYLTEEERCPVRQSIIEHRFSRKGFGRTKRARQMKAEVLEEVKKEIKKMLDAGFIRPCRYAEWISNVVPVQCWDGDGA
ncbi:hypothetical protein QYE76_034887 [Lolium multiflorum]|uniref:Uncharacterized protein n=1 Tax=Lolium multiflorum TaxID=4521 RepID=A0AAD8R0I1_LOLMU|nr:hypothetical protein QYE76_034887 [Lolium multiflorum]